MKSSPNTVTLLLLALSILLLTSSAMAFRNSLYVITNAEEPSLGLSGLTPIGFQRAQDCIPKVFGSMNIGLIVACAPDNVSGECFTAVQTATPLANSLSLPVNATCGTDEEADDDCVTKLLNKFTATSSKAILIVWDFAETDSLFENIDIETPDDDDDDSEGGNFDVITTVRNGAFIGQSSQNCEGIDGVMPGTEFRQRVRRRSSSTRAKKAARESSGRRISSRITGTQL